MKKFLFCKKRTLIHDPNTCSYCGLCARRCPHKALLVDQPQQLWKLRLWCMGCGRCVRECPKQALSFK